MGCLFKQIRPFVQVATYLMAFPVTALCDKLHLIIYLEVVIYLEVGFTSC